MILAWASFALAALLFAPVAVAMARVTRRHGHPTAAVAAIGIAAGVVQAIGLSRWVYAVPGLASGWVAGDAGTRVMIETVFTTLHQSAGVGIGEAIGQTLTGMWLIGVSLAQREHPRFGKLPAALGGLGGCPFAPGATGNVCTEDVVHMFEQMGVATGVDLQSLMTQSLRLPVLVGHDTPGQVVKAGPSFLRERSETGH